MQGLALAVLLLAAFLACSNCKTDQNGPKFDKDGNIWLEPPDAKKENSMVDKPDLEPMLNPEADYKYFERHGDYTVIRPKFLKRYRNGGRPKRLVHDWIRHWENGIIPYVISEASYNELQVNLITKAMAEWEEHTCIRFKKRSTESDYVNIFPGTGCFSYVGRTRGIQGLSLAPSCFWESRVVLHELGHLVGFFHEHSRPDRDESIRIHYQNIANGVPYREFDAFDHPGYNTQGITYDYNSIMHYNADQAAQNGLSTIESHDGKIPVGLSVALTELDILKTKVYYNCPEIPPPRSTIYVPLPVPDISPRPFECGRFIDGELSGTVVSPLYPLYQGEQSCSWQIQVPSGYRIKLNINSFGLKESRSTPCTEGNITMYAHLDANNPILTTICHARAYPDYITRLNEAHIQYRSGIQMADDPPMGFNMSFTAQDINECSELNKCSHECINTPGGYSCRCPEGFFLSADVHHCFDINECAINGALCESKCRNFAGHYRCICPDKGLNCTDSDELSGPLTLGTDENHEATIMTTPPLTTTLPSTASTPSVTTSPTTTTTPPPTMTTPPSTMTTPPYTVLDALSGNFNTPNWPETYPINIDMEWLISCPNDNYHVEISFSQASFGIAGKLPDCSKDWIRVHDGGQRGTSLGQFCYLNAPPVVESTRRKVLVEFHAGPAHGPTRKGFSASYLCVQHGGDITTAETKTQCPSVTLPTLPQCGFHLNSNSGVFSTPNWPLTYNMNQDCEWIIELPDCNKVIEITFSAFSIAGKFPDCIKDQVYIRDGVEEQSEKFGPFCHTSLPEVVRTSSNVARVTFHAGPQHGSLRLGFSANFQAVD